ncbi:outer membrane beta-barrel family protein [Algoriphagus sp. NG3]|uniref:outer membrane beta-barrel family protein n=1 Tax=unclassified Algoriphagus TaxID=2641541 RepID=UPI002A8261A1|nr:outer membrane beta-barrel family protein [Algoriphagus sp. NG3]WPR74807.1 outer membrane beta-barrel family protein [Algoriphagus sp. NG3]
MKTCSLFTLVSFLLSLPGLAQSTLSGRVVDGSDIPVSFANIAVLNASDSSLVQGTVSDEDGHFLIKLDYQGTVLVKVSFLGYRDSYSQQFRLTEEARSIAIEKLIIIDESLALGEVVVKGQKAMLQQKLDRFEVNIENSVLAEGNNVFEMLQKSPGITVQGEGDFTLQGRNGARVMIDGRATYLSGEQLANMLKGMQADQVSKIELMPNPSAKQDAAGSGGIINIVMKKSAVSGLKGDLTVKAGHGRLPSYGASGGASYRSGFVNYFLSGSYYNEQEREYGAQERTFYGLNAQGERVPIMLSSQKYSETYDPGRGFNIRTGFDFYLSEKSTLGINVNALRGRWFTDNPSSMEIQNLTTGEVTESTSTQNNADQTYNNLTFNMYYTLEIGDADQLLKVSLDYAPHTNDDYTEFFSDYYNGTDSEIIYHSARRNKIDLSNTSHVASIDYENPLENGGKFEAGLKSSYFVVQDQAVNDTLSSTVWVVDLSTTNQFKYTEEIHAGYFLYESKIGDLSFQAGLRGELTRTVSNQITMDSLVTRDYFNLFPNLYLGYPIGESQHLKLSYSRRINRPGDHDVNPFRVFIDPFSYYAGNPYLKPSYTDSYELSHSLVSTFFTSVFYSRGTDVINRVTAAGDIPGSTFNRPENFGSFTNYGVSLMATTDFATWWTANHYGSLFINKYDGEFQDVILANSSMSYSFNSRHSFEFGKSIRGEMIAIYNSPLVSGINKIQSDYSLSFGIEKKVMGDKGSLKLAGNGIIRRGRIVTRSELGDLSTYGFERSDNRNIQLSFSFKFGGE